MRQLVGWDHKKIDEANEIKRKEGIEQLEEDIAR